MVLLSFCTGIMRNAVDTTIEAFFSADQRLLGSRRVMNVGNGVPLIRPARLRG